MNSSFRRSVSFLVLAIFVGSFAGCGGGSAVSLDKALVLVEEGRYEEAIPLLKSASGSLSDSASVWCNLGVCYLETGDTDAAITALRKGVDLASGSPEAYEYLGRAYLKAGKLDDARDVLVTANQIGPGNPRILTAIGVVEMKAGNRNQAFASTMEALDYDSGYAPALYNIAVFYRDTLKNRKLAERFFRRFLSAAPSDPRAEEARGFLNPRAEVKDSRVKGLVEKAKRSIEAEEYDVALIALKEALAKDPGYAEAVWHMATLSDHVLGNAEEAIGFYNDFKSKFPNDRRSVQASQRAAHLKADLAKDEKIKEEAAKIVEIPVDPIQTTTAKDAMSAGYTWQQKGDTAKAEAFYTRAIELDGSSAEAFYRLGLLYYKNKNLDGARTAFAASVGLDKDYTDARYMLANTQFESGDRIGAVKNLNGVLLRKPDFAKAHYLLGFILGKENQLEASKMHFDRYAKLKDMAVR